MNNSWSRLHSAMSEEAGLCIMLSHVPGQTVAHTSTSKRWLREYTRNTEMKRLTASPWPTVMTLTVNSRDSCKRMVCNVGLERTVLERLRIIRVPPQVRTGHLPVTIQKRDSGFSQLTRRNVFTLSTDGTKRARNRLGKRHGTLLTVPVSNE
jgi:hypothetical protein